MRREVVERRVPAPGKALRARQQGALAGLAHPGEDNHGQVSEGGKESGNQIPGQVLSLFTA
jgi:hypothetical protein